MIFRLVLLFWSLCMWVHPHVLFKLVNWVLMFVFMCIIMSMFRMSCHILVSIVSWFEVMPF